MPSLLGAVARGVQRAPCPASSVPGEDAEQRQVAEVLLGEGLEDHDRRDGSPASGLQTVSAPFGRADLLGLHVERRGQQVHDLVEQVAHALVVVGRRSRTPATGRAARRAASGRAGSPRPSARRSSRNFFMSTSSPVAASSSSTLRAPRRPRPSCRRDRRCSRPSPPCPCPANVRPSCGCRSTTPWKVSASPIGSWTGTTLTPRRSCSERTAAPKSACSLSIMLTTTTTGDLLLAHDLPDHLGARPRRRWRRAAAARRRRPRAARCRRRPTKSG